MKLDLPRASNEPSTVEPKTVTIAITADGSVHWDQTHVDAEELTLRLEQAAAREPQPEIHIRGDRRVEYEKVIMVMAAAQRVGMQKLGFITDPAE